MSKRELYYCNYIKNNECKKDECYSQGGQCYLTTERKNKATGLKNLQMWIKYHKDYNAWRKKVNQSNIKPTMSRIRLYFYAKKGKQVYGENTTK